MDLIIIYMSLALVISAMCSLLEATLLSTPMSYVTSLETQGVNGALRLKRLKKQFLKKKLSKAFGCKDTGRYIITPY